MIDNRILGVFAVLSMVACQGNFGSGTALPGTASGPVGMPPDNGSPGPNAPLAPVASAASSAAPDTATVALADAATGLKCPDVDGFGCVLSFNVPSAEASATPRPIPTSTEIATAAASPDLSASPAVTATPISGPSMVLTLAAQPKDAPLMVNHNPKAVATTALARVTLKPSADFRINGLAIAAFTLPAAQIPDRGFALQLFEEKKKKRIPLYSLPKSELSKDKSTLTFTFKFPKTTLPKGHTYLLVLYGDELPAASSSPAPAASSASTP